MFWVYITESNFAEKGNIMQQILWQSTGGIAALAFLYYGAELLVKGGVAIARKLHISSLVIGLTLVACATSAPELVVSTEGAWKGFGGIALGNVVGSNICNIALILGCSALVRPLTVHKDLFKWDVPIMVLSAILLALITLLTGGMGRVTGGVFLLCLVIYTVINVRSARKKELSGLSGNQENEEKKETKELKFVSAVFFCVLGLGLLIGGGKLLVESAVFFAGKMGVSQAIIGLTIVAVGTSLPELATSMVAAFRKEEDIAIGNVVGSNIFNILGIMGVAPLVKPFSASGIGVMDMGWMIALSLLLVPLMYSGWKISRKEGAFLLLSYIIYIALLIK